MTMGSPQRCPPLHDFTFFRVLMLLLWIGTAGCKSNEGNISQLFHDHTNPNPSLKWGGGVPHSHSCIHDVILEQRRRSGLKEFSVTPQAYATATGIPGRGGRTLMALSSADGKSNSQPDSMQPIRIYLNYDAVGHSLERDCQAVGQIVKLGEPVGNAGTRFPACDSRANPPVYGDCWYNCTAEDISGKDKRERLHRALGETAAWFKRALAVEPVKGRLRLSGYSACGQDGGVQLPRKYVDEGISYADLVLLVTTRPTTGNTLAWAVACERDQWGRAIAGHVNVAPRHLTAEAETLLSATLIHEVMHVLGFDPHAFAHFRDERKRRRSQVVVQSFDPKLGRMVSRVVLPRVMMHGRQHYKAFSKELIGLELEDGGGRGTAGSHWEKRLLMNEIMTGSVDTRSVVSSMTLALLEDSGWYRANMSMAEQLDWGKDQGVDFVTNPCSSWKGAYRCNSTHLSGCTYNREAEGYCPIVRYSSDLPTWARYFVEPNKGGQSSLADYCAYYVAYSDGSCTDTNSARAPDQMLGEMHGHNSRCMSSSLVRTGFVRSSLTQGNGCYQHRCRNSTLEVAVDGIWKDCPQNGGPIQFPNFNGYLICPAYYELCDEPSLNAQGQCPNACNMNGECIDGKCSCFIGFDGVDCSRRLCPNNCSGHGVCTFSGLCQCTPGFTGVDCSTAGCDEQCSLHGGVCDNGMCEFRCSDYAGYTCQNTSGLLSSLSMCGEVLMRDPEGQHCAPTPTEASMLQQLEAAVVIPNYNRLIPNTPSFWGGGGVFRNRYCTTAAKRLACWISIQQCDEDGDNRLRVCHSACKSYNSACGARLDCSDRTLFSSQDDNGRCTGAGGGEWDEEAGLHAWWHLHRHPHLSRILALIGIALAVFAFISGALRPFCFTAASRSLNWVKGFDEGGEMDYTFLSSLSCQINADKQKMEYLSAILEPTRGCILTNLQSLRYFIARSPFSCFPLHYLPWMIPPEKDDVGGASTTQL